MQKVQLAERKRIWVSSKEKGKGTISNDVSRKIDIFFFSPKHALNTSFIYIVSQGIIFWMPMSWMGRGGGGITYHKDISVPRKNSNISPIKKTFHYFNNKIQISPKNSDIAKKIFKYLTYQKNIPVSPHRCTGRTSSASRREIYTSPGAKSKKY